MPIFEKRKRGKTVKVTEPLGQDNIYQFVAEYGEDYARIYFAALSDFTAALRECVQPTHAFGTEIRRTPHICRKMTTDFFHNNQDLLELSDKILKTPSGSKNALPIVKS